MKYVSILVVLAIGVAAGFGIAKLAGKNEPHSATSNPIAAIALETPEKKLSVAEAESARNERYANVASIADVLELPTDFAQTEALYVLAGRSDADALKPLIRQAAGIEADYERRAALSVLFTRFVELDMRDAIDYVRRIDIGGYRIRVIRSMFASVAKFEPDRAIDALNALGDPLEIEAASEGIVIGTLDFDKDVREQILSRLPESFNPGHFAARTLAERASRSPVEAAEEAMQIASRSERESALRGIADTWARQDPVEAMRYAETITDQQSRYHFVYALMRRWAQSDGEGAIEMIRTMPANKMRRQMLYTTLSEFAHTNPQRAVEMASSLGNDFGPGYGGRFGLSSMVYGAWAQDDPQSALAHAETITDAVEKRSVINGIAGQYAQQDARAALAWANTLDGRDRTRVLEMVLQHVASSDPDAAFDFLLSMEDTSMRGRVMSSVIFQLSQSDPMRAAENLDLMPPGQRPNALVSIATGFAQKDIDQALSWINGLDDQHKAMAIGPVLGQWATRDVTAAARYVDQLPPENQWQAAQTVSRAFAQEDPRGAFNWILGLDSDEATASAVPLVVSSWAGQDPRAAANAVRQYADEDWAQNATQTVMTNWGMQDPAAAGRWLESLDAGDVKNNSARSLATQWAQSDGDAAARWARTQRGETRDHALSGIVSSPWIEVDDRLRLVQSIEKNELRYRAVSNMIYAIPPGGRDAAERVIRESRLTPQQQQSLQRQVESRPGF